MIQGYQQRRGKDADLLGAGCKETGDIVNDRERREKRELPGYTVYCPRKGIWRSTSTYLIGRNRREVRHAES